MTTTGKYSASDTGSRGYAQIDLTPDRWDEIVDIEEWAFLNPWLPEERAASKGAFVWDRARGIAIQDARHGIPGELVAVRCSYPFQMLVPGGERVPTSGLSWVGVHPGHRRRGLLTAMIREHFDHALARGEMLSVLTASEPKIYQRFGYGLGTWHLRAKFGRGDELRDVPGADELSVRLERLQREHHAELMADLQRLERRPGAIVRDGEAITTNLFAADANERPQEEPRRIAIVSAPDGQPQGFAVFRRKAAAEWSGSGGEVVVFNFITTSAAAARRLWGVLFDLDLTSEITVTSLPLDDRLLWLAKDQRAPKAIVEDDLWVRILDVPRALEARAYESAVNIVIEVTDYYLPANAGLWRITTAPVDNAAPVDTAEPGESTTFKDELVRMGSAHTAKVSKLDGVEGDLAAVPDLSIGIQELSAAYLGGVTIHTLTEAGLVTELTAGAARLLSVAMQSPQAPASTIHF